MKISTGFLLLIAGSHAIAESQFARDLKELTAQRYQAFAAAAAPVNRRYKEGLDALLRRATQANDLDAALKIREAIGKPPGSTKKPKVRTAEELAAYLDGTVWDIHNGDPKAEASHTMTFDKNGFFKQSNGPVGSLQFLGPRSIKLWGFDPASLNDDLTEFRAQGNITYFGKLKPAAAPQP